MGCPIPQKCGVLFSQGRWHPSFYVNACVDEIQSSVIANQDIFVVKVLNQYGFVFVIVVADMLETKPPHVFHDFDSDRCTRGGDCGLGHNTIQYPIDHHESEERVFCVREEMVMHSD